MAEPKGPGVDISSGGEPGSAQVARVSLNVGRATLGWGVVFVVLVAAADFPATAQLSASFATLIFIAVMLLYGPTALGTLSSLVNRE